MFYGALAISCHEGQSDQSSYTTVTIISSLAIHMKYVCVSNSLLNTFRNDIQISKCLLLDYYQGALIGLFEMFK